MLNDLLLFTEAHTKWFYVILVYQMFLFSLLLYYYGKWTQSKPKLYLSLFMLFSGIMFMAFMFRQTSRPILGDFFLLILPGGFLFLMPLVYFYFRSLVSTDFKVNRAELLHFAPAFFIVCLNALLVFMNYSDHSHDLNAPTKPLYFMQISMLLLLIQFFFYTFKVLSLQIRNKEAINRSFVYPRQSKIMWLVLLSLSFVLYSLVLGLMVIDDVLPLGVDRAVESFPYSVVFIALTMFIGVSGISQQELKINVSGPVLIEPLKQETPEITLNQSVTSDISNGNGNRNSHSQRLSEKKKEELISRIETIMSKKAYRDPHCSIAVIAKIIGSNNKYVSQVINDKLGCSFTTYVNNLRIREAQQIISERKSERYSFEGIGNMVGFQSKSTFNTQFKKFTGMTPTEYLKNVKS